MRTARNLGIRLRADVVFLIAVLGWAVAVSAQSPIPKIGYAFPAGGRQGTTVEVILGGRQLNGAREVFVSGTGVRGRVLKNCRLFVTDTDTRTVLRTIFLNAKTHVETGKEVDSWAIDPEIGKVTRSGDTVQLNPEKVMSQYIFFDMLKNPTPEALQLIYYEHFAPRPDRTPNTVLQMASIVELTIDADAPPGDRDLRLLTGTGFTLPIRFQVGPANEVNELEPNDSDFPASAWLPDNGNSTNNPMASLADVQFDFWSARGREAFLIPKAVCQLPILDLPVVINGQIRRGDVDRFKFKAAAGEKLVIGVRARHLIPFLADAVPGWFQAAITLFGPTGNVVGESSSYRTDPDPLLVYEVPQDGVYTLQIQDSIFRGREDFVYRISIGQFPLITSMFPLGGRANQPLAVDLNGWNLPTNVALLDMQGADSPRIRTQTALKGVWLPYPIRYAVDLLPEMLEKEPNDDIKTAKKLTLPIIVNGRIDKPGDVDCFRFSGRTGQKVVLDISARNLGSPLDGVLELLDSTGKPLAQNDDRADCDGPNIGLETHHADPYLMVELPADGEYIARVYHSGSQAGPEYAYRLRISAPLPDFAVFVTPSCCVLNQNSTPFQVHVVRKDGFDGEIRLRLKNGSPGISLGAATIPTGAGKADCELIAGSQYFGMPRSLLFDAVATINGKDVVRAVTVVDDYEQAFIYHHWVPADGMIVVRQRTRR